MSAQKRDRIIALAIIAAIALLFVVVGAFLRGGS